ncbi:hypothetical protein ACFX13_020094 [Malus domestica]|uniref:transcription factor bHLH30-like n=1 Tax=Malus domestica TaxID=3750 RepID=UPI0010AA87C8|nr:transcription factor bHLH30-like [Malus domestica]XP_050124809.1 transcription factor bHLH30-like [Malus sylvestris]
MLPFQNYSESERQSWSSQNRNNNNLRDGADSILSSAASATETAKSAEASTSHKEAERRRRQRINAHLSTLRTLLPNTTRTDKASLLAEVVQHVRELRRQADDLARQGRAGSEAWPFPAESDEVTLNYCNGGTKLLKATLSCEDRPGLNRDLVQAIRSVRARAVRAEMMTVGSRTKNVVVMQWAGGGGEEGFRALKRALKAVVENRTSGSRLGKLVSSNNRGRVFEDADEDMSFY